MWVAREESFFWNPAVNKALERDELNLPDPVPLPTSTDTIGCLNRMSHFPMYSSSITLFP